MSELLIGPDGNLQVALATWIYLLHTSGIVPDHADIAAACAAVAAAEDAEAGDAAGQALIDHVGALLNGADDGAIAVTSLARSLYGEAVSDGLGHGDREARTKRIRAYQFQRGLPWLARIYERRPDGEVGPSWLLVERVTDLVRVMDPNPWNDVDEDRALPVEDFQVLWELDGCSSLALEP